MVADSSPLDEEQDSDLHRSEKLDPDLYYSEKLVPDRIRNKIE